MTNLRELAEATGADFDRLRRVAFAFPGSATLCLGLEIRYDRGVTFLLSKASEYGGDPEAYSRSWAGHRREREGQPRREPEVRLVRAASIAIGNPVAEADVQTLTQAVNDLLGVVLLQQQQIEAIESRSREWSLGGLHVEVSKLATTHVREAIDRAASAPGRIKTLRVGGVKHSVSVSAKRKRTDKESSTSRAEDESRRDLKGQISGEVSGIAKLIAGIKAKGGIDIAKVGRRVEELATVREQSEAESIEGTFTVEQEGSEISLDD